MYSPFVNAKGQPISIANVKYKHLNQLVECEEGYHIEYKARLEDNGKAQLAKEIASFVNSEGGWLIVGIEDKTKEIVPIEKKDYSQKIGKITSKISPMPEFETKFISIPDDSQKGVLLVYVYEGKYAPYICNGTVYVRSGSSKEPVISANRGNIEYLIERTKNYSKEIDDFFSREYYFMSRRTLVGDINIPVCILAFKSISSKKSKLDSYKKREEVVKLVKQLAPIFEQVQYTMDSIIFFHKAVLPGTNQITVMFEVFYDWSFKMCCPLRVADENALYTINEYLHSRGFDDQAIKNIKFVEGVTFVSALAHGLFAIEGLAKKYRLKEKNYLFQFELINSGEYVLALNGDKFSNYLDNQGLPFVSLMDNKTNRRFLRDIPRLRFNKFLPVLLSDLVGPTFGYESGAFLDMWLESYHLYLENMNGIIL